MYPFVGGTISLLQYPVGVAIGDETNVVLNIAFCEVSGETEKQKRDFQNLME